MTMLKGNVLLLLFLSYTVHTNGQQYRACGGKPADIMFLLDSSSSIKFADFQKELNFTQEVVQLFDIGPDKTQIGLISYSDTVVPEFSLGEYKSNNEIIKKIKKVEFQGGNTNTGEALSYVRQKAFSQEPTSSDRPKIAILLTDGQSNDVARTLSEASRAKDEGITLFVIGIGKQVDETELESIASRPLKTYMFMIGNFDALDSIKEELAINACEVLSSAEAPQSDAALKDDEILYGDGKCFPPKPVSIGFAVDTSSVGAENAYFIMILINRIGTRLQMDKQQISLSVVTSGCSNGITSGDALVDHVHDQKTLEKGLGAMTSSSFQSVLGEMRRKIQSDRVKKIGFIFLSRQLSKKEYHKTELESRRAKFKKMEIFVVGIGNRFDESQAIGLTMEKDHYLHAHSYDTLYELEGPLLYRICELK